ncbi:hypothetical protein RvY_15567 [Ramazzottius varieornatus]|uniref:Uncharacterized protein n=1 Tax=Ramazzottius varieornatus TaxID=947166 RepID=A0A1D1VWJ7_RAMVA|nr:hypothetical protein RvY_15567 [Ramazzottius varieornatus]
MLLVSCLLFVSRPEVAHKDLSDTFRSTVEASYYHASILFFCLLYSCGPGDLRLDIAGSVQLLAQLGKTIRKWFGSSWRRQLRSSASCARDRSLSRLQAGTGYHARMPEQTFISLAAVSPLSRLRD